MPLPSCHVSSAVYITSPVIILGRSLTFPPRQGAGGVPLTSCHVSSAAYTGDIHLALQFLSGLFPGAPLLACGYSMGGACLGTLG